MADLSKMSNEELLAIAGVSAPKSRASSMSTEQLLEIAGVEPTEENLGLNTPAKKILPTFVTGAEPLPGERTLMGEIFDRPAATAREAIRANPALAAAGPLAGLVGLSGVAGPDVKSKALKGATRPDESPTFLEESQQAPVNTSIPLTGENKLVDSLSLIERFGKGLGRDLLGFAADTVTNPADTLITYLTGGAGKAGKAIPKKTSTAFTKGVRPSVRGQGSAAKVKAYKDNVTLAVDTIIENKNNLKYVDDAGEVVTQRLPQNLDEFSQAVGQTKKDVYKAYSGMKEAAGESKRVIFTDDVASELRAFVDDSVTADLSPDLIQKANKMADILDDRGFYTLDEANEFVERLNQQLKAFYRNPDMKLQGENNLKALMANRMRKKLDAVINSENLGAGDEAVKAFGNLKRRYGALRTIEDAVNHRMVVDARKNVRGLADFTDIFTAADAMQGVATGNVAQTGRAGVGFVTKEIIKRANDPNRHIANLFTQAERVKLGIPTPGRVISRTAPAGARAIQRAQEANQQPLNSARSRLDPALSVQF